MAKVQKEPPNLNSIHYVKRFKIFPSPKQLLKVIKTNTSEEYSKLYLMKWDF